ncbi:hypothetical protein ACSS6W_004734 [Trichoderma asperelloides]
MTNQQHEGSGLNWSPRIQRRGLVLASLILVAFSVIVFVEIATIETVRLERRALAERQFQLGGFLGGVFREVVDTTAAGASSIAHTTEQDFATTPSRVTEATITANSVPETTQINDTVTSNLSISSPNSLLETLADAVKEEIMKSDQPLASAARHRQTVLSDMIGGNLNALALSEDSSLLPLLKTPRPSSTQDLPTPSVGLLGGFWGDSLKLRIHNARAATEEPMPDSSANGASFLGDLSKIVAEISGIDPAAAARLTDTVLDALHVDSSAVAAAIPKVAKEAAVAVADLLPLVIPAVAKAMNQPLPLEPPVSTLDMVETLNKVLQQGTTVINDLSRALEDITDPALLEVVNQLALIVSAVASYLKKPLCAIDQVLDGTSFEEVVPCDKVETGSLTSTGQIATLATLGIPELATRTSESEGIATPAAPKPYLSSENPASPPNPTPPSTPIDESPTKTSNPAPTDGENEGGLISNSEVPTKASSAHSSCPTCPSCDQCSPKICSVKGPESLSVHQPPNPSIGPCPGSGFKCDECLDGWFCPPRETPAQVVPCGLGWPCYHCSAGWFCELTETSSPTSPPSSTARSPSKGIGSTNTSSGTAPTKTSKNDNLPADWSHLGCFQDAISRILLGAKPVDYLQGDMSSRECVDHCISGGYKFAGTENGRECWCGTSIRDDSVRFPESQCGKPCQGQPTELCGGSWAIDVFICSDKGESSQEPSGGPVGSFVFRFLSNLKGSRGKTDHQRLYGVA